jgi:ribosome-binding protein aMBF1 (putative translation factor)
MKKNRTTRTSDALVILEHLYVKNKPERLAALHQAETDFDVAQQLYDLRTSAGLSQRELAKLVGTTASVICQLEDADYQGHSLRMLHRIATALKQRVIVRFEPVTNPKPPKARTLSARH